MKVTNLRLYVKKDRLKFYEILVGVLYNFLEYIGSKVILKRDSTKTWSKPKLFSVHCYITVIKKKNENYFRYTHAHISFRLIKN